MTGQSQRGRGKGKPFQPGDPRAGRPAGVQNKVTLEAREIARNMISNEEYRKNLEARFNAGECAPPIEALIWHYAFGKPKETVEVMGDLELSVRWRPKIGEAVEE